MKHAMNLCDAPFKAIRSGLKSIEMRTNKESRKAIRIGDIIEFTNNVSGEKLCCEVLNKFEYKDFIDLYKNHDKTALGYRDDEASDPKDMLAYYSEEEISKYGVVGIKIRMIGEKMINEEMIAYCGLNCSKCEAYLATINNDDALREKVAKEWSAMNKVEIKPSDINCMGCTSNGIKFAYCEFMCAIRKCAVGKGHCHCGKCANLGSCDKVSMIISNNKEALNNLKK